MILREDNRKTGNQEISELSDKLKSVRDDIHDLNDYLDETLYDKFELHELLIRVAITIDKINNLNKD